MHVFYKTEVDLYMNCIRVHTYQADKLREYSLVLRPLPSFCHLQYEKWGIVAASELILQI